MTLDELAKEAGYVDAAEWLQSYTDRPSRSLALPQDADGNALCHEAQQHPAKALGVCAAGKPAARTGLSVDDLSHRRGSTMAVGRRRGFSAESDRDGETGR